MFFPYIAEVWKRKPSTFSPSLRNSVSFIPLYYDSPFGASWDYTWSWKISIKSTLANLNHKNPYLGGRILKLRKMETSFSTDCTSQKCLLEGRIQIEYILSPPAVKPKSAWTIIPVQLLTHVYVLLMMMAMLISFFGLQTPGWLLQSSPISEPRDITSHISPKCHTCFPW